MRHATVWGLPDPLRPDAESELGGAVGVTSGVCALPVVPTMALPWAPRHLILVPVLHRCSGSDMLVLPEARRCGVRLISPIPRPSVEPTPSSLVFVLPSSRVETPYSMSFAKRLARGIEELGVRVHVHGVVKSSNPLQFVRQGLALRKLVQESGAELVVAQYGTYTGLLSTAFGRHRVPTVVTFRGSDLNPEPNTPRLVQFAQHTFSHIASWLADGIVCVSEELARRLRVKRPLTVIASPTDLEIFRPRDQAECRRALGWPTEGQVAVFLPGANPAVKGAGLAQDVRDLLNRRGSDVSVHIVDETVSLETVALHLNAADALLFLSRQEGSPNLVREACACNLPVVTTRVGDVETVLAGVTPSRVVERDVEMVADALESVVGLGVRSNGREHVLSYSTGAIAARTLEFYAQIVQTGRRGSPVTPRGRSP
jgi:teichuronic acid biosynthesis glycosyltransferase TuaC